MSTYHSLINEGKERLYKAGQGEQAAQLFMVELCRQKDINLYISMDEEADEQIQTDYLEGIHLMENGEPLGYVLGYECFYGYDFIVNEDVLIHRPETEELVGLVLTKFESDISKEALVVAQKNNEKLNAHVNFICGSMLDPFVDRDLHCDILVCNPPYIPSEEKMEQSVVDYEPHVALFGGEDGLKFYRDVFEKAHLVLNEKAFLAFEMGWDQGESLSNLAREYFESATITVHKDMSGKDRMLTIEL